MEQKYESYLENAETAIEQTFEEKFRNVERLEEVMSAMRKLKKFKDTKEAKAALEKDFEAVTKKFQEMEDLISDMVHEVAALFADPGPDGEMSDEEYDDAFDKAHDILGPLMKGVNTFDFKRVKEKIFAHITRNISTRHDAESQAASDKAAEESKKPTEEVK